MNIYFLKIFHLHFQKLFLSLFYFLDKIFVGKNCIGKLFKICPENGLELLKNEKRKNNCTAGLGPARAAADLGPARAAAPAAGGLGPARASLSAQWPATALGFRSGASIAIRRSSAVLAGSKPAPGRPDRTLGLFSSRTHRSRSLRSRSGLRRQRRRAPPRESAGRRRRR